MAYYPPSIYGVWQDDPAAPALQAAHADWYGGTEKAAQEAVTEAEEREWPPDDMTITAGDPTAIERQRQRRNRIAEGFAFAFAMKFGFFNEGGAANALAAADALISELDK